jgi:hypothetical protein
MSADEYLNLATDIRPLIMEIRRQKQASGRLQPSASRVDRSQLFSAESRRRLLDKVAALVDENYAGRSGMCLQFAELLHRALTHMRFPSQGQIL